MNMQKNDYQLRQAAGKYWLLDMGQKGFEYHKPVCLNESGAYLWELLQKGLSKEDIAGHLCTEFGLKQADARQDAEAFFRQLEEFRGDI